MPLSRWALISLCLPDAFSGAPGLQWHFNCFWPPQWLGDPFLCLIGEPFFLAKPDFFSPPKNDSYVQPSLTGGAFRLLGLREVCVNSCQGDQNFPSPISLDQSAGAHVFF